MKNNSAMEHKNLFCVNRPLSPEYTSLYCKYIMFAVHLRSAPTCALNFFALISGLGCCFTVEKEMNETEQQITGDRNKHLCRRAFV